MGNNRPSSLNLYGWLLVVGVLLSGPQAIAVGVPSMVKDLSTNPASSNIAGLIRVGDTVYFVADDGVHGRELWKTNGTPETTVMVKDIRPGAESAWGEYETLVAKELNGVLYFKGDDGIHGNELWMSTGNAAGTALVKDIHPAVGSGLSDLFVFDNHLFFSASDGTHGRELWKTDGEEAGTVLVKDINVSGDSAPTEFFDFNGILLFSADSYDKRQLWKTDGTEAGTDWIKIINQRGHSNPQGMALFDGKVFFSASNGPDGTELWTTDGTAENTKMFLDISSSGSSYPSNLVAIDGLLYFAAAEFTGREPWISNGEPTWGAGTRRFASLGRIGSNPEGFIKYKDEVFFTAKGDLGTPFSDPGTLWKTDNTFENTVSIAADIPVGAEILIRDEMLVILANKIWTSNGTKEGTVAVSDAFPDVQVGVDGEWAELNGVYITVGFDEDHGNELWAYDLAGDGPVLLKDIHSGTTGMYYFGNGSGDNPFVAINGVGYFAAESGWEDPINVGNELWRSDGTEAGTWLVKDINPGEESSSPQNFFNVGGVLFFTADDGVHGIELWKSDGSKAGTMLVKDITDTNPFDTEFGTFAVIDETLFFSAKNWTMQNMLWKSDGTEEGTVLIKDIYQTAGIGSMYIGEMVSFQGMLFFSALGDNVIKKQLWTSDGTGEGTVLFKVLSESYNSSPHEFTVIGDTLYFIATFGRDDVDLWKTDGSPDGTVMVKDFSPTEGSGPRELVSFKDTLFFKARDGVPGMGLWTSDGTAVGTKLVHDLNTAYDSWDLTAGDDFMLFMSKVSSWVSTIRLWRSDGTTTGTRPIEIILPDGAETEYGSVRQFTVALGSIFFTMEDEVHGREVWSTDGTDGGTQLLMDLYPGSVDSNPDLLGVIGARGTAAETLLFGADDAFHGNELWKVSKAAPVIPVSFEEWQAEHFTASQLADSGISGPDGDPDGDRISNLREYVHGLNPSQAGSNPIAIEISRNSSNQIDGFTVTFPWSRSAIRVGYELQISTDILNWSTLASEVVQVVPGPLTDWITLRAEPTGFGSIDTFVRVRIFEL